MKREDFKPGDIVEAYGKRWVIGGYTSWSSMPYGYPAKKDGTIDQRKNGSYINPDGATLITRPEVKPK